MSKSLGTIKSAGLFFLMIVNLSTGYVYSEGPEDAALLQGIELSKQGKYVEAIAQYDKAIELNPQDAEAFNNRATAYGFQGNFAAAISDYTKAIELKPSFFVAYYSRATAYEVNGDLDAALSDFNRAIEINSSYGQAYADRAKILYIKQEYDKGLADVVKSKELGVTVDPNVVEALQGIATKTKP